MPDGIPAPNPIYEIPIKNVTGNANVKIQNKNLFDKDKDIVLGKRLGENDTIIKDNTGFYQELYISVKPNTQYTVTHGDWLRIFYYKSNKEYLTFSLQRGAVSRFTTPENCDFIRVTGSQSLSLNNDLQIEQGTTATSYVPHAEQNYPFTFAEGQRGMQGTQLKDDGIHQKRNPISLIDDYIGSLITLSNGNKAIVINLPNKKRTTGNNIICNKAINNLTFSDGTFYENNTNIVAIGNQNDTLETLKEKYIGSIFEYTLEQEEIIPYNETQQAQYNAIKEAISYYEQTNISGSSDELSPIITASAVGDLNLILDTMQSKIDLLEG